MKKNVVKFMLYMKLTLKVFILYVDLKTEI